jgi:hypothetical protein
MYSGFNNELKVYITSERKPNAMKVALREFQWSADRLKIWIYMYNYECPPEAPRCIYFEKFWLRHVGTHKSLGV